MEAVPPTRRLTGLDAQAASIYERYPLEVEGSDIRILMIHPGEWDETIQCSLRVESLANRPFYRALSWVWGSKDTMDTILIDNQNFKVTSNLVDALKRLRAHHCDEEIALWVDAICIDQGNVSERSSQVAIMGEIYSQCQEVSVWLGELQDIVRSCIKYSMDNVPSAHTEHPDHCTCMDEMRVGTVQDQVHEASQLSDSKIAELAVPVLIRIVNSLNCADLNNCRLYESREQMIAFRALCSNLLAHNPWFQRMWTVQEVIQPARGFIYLGPVSFPVEILFQATDTYNSHAGQGCCVTRLTESLNACVPLMKCCLPLANTRRLAQEDVTDLFFMRVMLIRRKATVDADHIYALLGLCENRLSIVPDYTQTAEDVFIDATRNFLKSLKLKTASWIFVIAPYRHRYPSLPSWTVDWTAMENGAYVNGRNASSQIHINYERNGNATDGNHSVAFSKDTMILIGHFIDEVKSTGVAVEEETDSLEGSTYFHSIVQSWRDLVCQHYEPSDPYILPNGYDPVECKWEIAWLLTLTLGYKMGIDSGMVRIELEQTQTLLRDAEHDSNSLLLLDKSLVVSRSSDLSGLLANMEDPSAYFHTVMLLCMTLDEKRLFLTRDHHIGLANNRIEPGDKVFLPSGCNVPILLRPVKDPNQESGRQTYTLSGSCYLHGFMDGPSGELDSPEEEVWVV